MVQRSMKIFFMIFSFSLVTACTEPDPSFSLLADNDVFLQNTNEINTKIDILWVIDNSGSMATSQDALVANFEEFIDGFRDRGFDFQMAVTTTDAFMDDYPDNIKDLPWSTYKPSLGFSHFRDGTDKTSHTGHFIVNANTPNFSDVFLTNVLQGINGYGDERAFSSFKTALLNPNNNGLVRQDSFLAVIIVSDEDDFSHDGFNFIDNINDPSIKPIEEYVSFLDDITNSSADFKRYSVSALAIFDEACRTQLNDSWPGRRIGERYKQLVEATGGEKGSLCDNFAVILDFISEGIIQLATQFYLSRKPKPETIKVIIDNKEVPQVADPSNPKDGWMYNADKNSVMFFGTAVPAQGANINIVYDPVAVGQ